MKKIMFSNKRKAGVLGSGWACIHVRWLLKVMSMGLVVWFVGSGVAWGQERKIQESEGRKNGDKFQLISSQSEIMAAATDNIVDEETKKEIISTTSPPTHDKIYIDFVGSGDIQKTISQGGDINANTGLGVIFERWSSTKKPIQSFELEAIFNIASTSDSIIAEIDNNDQIQNRRDFGAYILNPISRRQSLYLNSNIYFGDSDSMKIIHFLRQNKILDGINFRMIASNNVWSYKDTLSNLGVLYFRVGLFKEFLPDNYRARGFGRDEGKSKYSIFLGVNYAWRSVFGDITSDNNNELRRKILGSERKTFGGFELNFGFKLNNLRAEFQMPIIPTGDRSSVAGLTNTQFIFSVRFIGGFGLRLNNNNNDNVTPNESSN